MIFTTDYKNVQLYDSDKYHVSFVRIPKTGSTSVVKMLEMREVDEIGYKPFTVIRNPIDRVLSMYHHCREARHRHTETLMDWLERISRDGFYNNHASMQCQFLHMDYINDGIKIYDTEALELLAIDYRVPVLHELKGTYQTKWQMTDEELEFAEALFFPDYPFYTYLTSRQYGQ